MNVPNLCIHLRLMKILTQKYCFFIDHLGSLNHVDVAIPSVCFIPNLLIVLTKIILNFRPPAAVFQLLQLDVADYCDRSDLKAS